LVKRIYANWRLKCEENRWLKLTGVGETGPKLHFLHLMACSAVADTCLTLSLQHLVQVLYQLRTHISTHKTH